MAYCSKCGNYVSDEAVYCSKCGNKIEHENEPGTENGIKKQQTGIYIGYNEPEPPKKSKKIISGFLKVFVFLFLVALVAGGFLLRDVISESKNTSSTGSNNAGDTQAPTATTAAEPAKELTMEVQQIDASEFPKIKLYLNIQDSDTGEVPENLDSTLFYLEKEDANSDYVKQTVSNVTQLNEAEALTVDMVADVSGSMSGDPLYEAKEIMCNFINTMQFDTGDMVELTSFSTGVNLEQTFTGDQDLLISDINALYTGDMTSLYDALYTAVERVASQSGARCVIAFTDGEDNYSSNTAQDVVTVANRYHIPIFIIGIGSNDYGDASYIASSSGGAYYNASDVSSMQSIYDDIYRMEKELYYLEFEDSTGAEMTDTANIKVGYLGSDYTGECTYTYVANTLLSVDGNSLYSDGAEYVVEQYIKNFDAAVSNSDYSYIEDYILDGSSLYQEQSKYVLRDIQEQLDSYEFVSIDYTDSNNCTIVTRETYYVQVAGKSLQLMTQECTYAVQKVNGEWKMTTFVDIDVLSRINQ